MECPNFKRVFSKAKEILIIVDGSYYCHHCWCRLISYPNGEGGYLIEKDITGDKWRRVNQMTRIHLNIFGRSGAGFGNQPKANTRPIGAIQSGCERANRKSTRNG